jgi:ribosome biogenesis GTPase
MTLEGLILKKSPGLCTVKVDGRLMQCSISSRLRKNLIYPIAAPTDPKRRGRRVQAVEKIDVVDPVAVGDRVSVVPAGDGTGMITEVLPRRNQLVRPTAEKEGQHPLDQVLVANVDQVVAVFALHPEPKWHLLDRYLVMAEAAAIPAVICLTKLDLVKDAQAARAEAQAYRRIGYPVVLTSGMTGEGVDLFAGLLTDRRSALLGKSGAGKTTLLNAVEPELGLRVNEVNQHTGEGRHTTTQLEMFELKAGGQVVDTPGLRLFKLVGTAPSDLAVLLPEMRPFVGQCRFGLSCGHTHEPGCAVKQAIEDGRVTRRRYESYLDMKAYFNL